MRDNEGDDRDRDGERREHVLGYTQAFSSLGGFMVSAVFTLLSILIAFVPEIATWLPDHLMGVAVHK